MGFPYYTGKPDNKRNAGDVRLPVSRQERQTDPAGYLPDDGLVDAANVALLLGQPLLLTGEPGVGKTQFARSLAWELGLGEPLKFETKSTSVARDLFYGYDTLGRFHASHTGEGSSRSLDYITWHALGIAILQSRTKSEIEQWLTPDFRHDGPRRSIVLIDEIDKAPRDFPNDLLNEIDNLYFRVPELGNVRIESNRDMPPILIITSNSEKNLPDAFLRRCVYYNIPFPGRERLIEIVIKRVGGFDGGDSPLLTGALDLFALLREPSRGLHKKPATAELIGWLTTLKEHGVKPDQPLRLHPDSVRRTVSALIKNSDDQVAAARIVEDWLNS